MPVTTFQGPLACLKGAKLRHARQFALDFCTGVEGKREIP
jgi:hypothetical protein